MDYQVLHKLVGSMSTWLHTVIKAKGDTTCMKILLFHCVIFDNIVSNGKKKNQNNFLRRECKIEAFSVMSTDRWSSLFTKVPCFLLFVIGLKWQAPEQCWLKNTENTDHLLCPEELLRSSTAYTWHTSKSLTAHVAIVFLLRECHASFLTSAQHSVRTRSCKAPLKEWPGRYVTGARCI